MDLNELQIEFNEAYFTFDTPQYCNEFVLNENFTHPSTIRLVRPNTTLLNQHRAKRKRQSATSHKRSAFITGVVPRADAKLRRAYVEELKIRMEYND